MALGASSQRVGRTVVGRALRLTTIGLLIGGLVTYTCAPVLASFLFGIGPRDPGNWTIAVLLVFVVAGASSLAPALRAAKVDPMVALRAE